MFTYVGRNKKLKDLKVLGQLKGEVSAHVWLIQNVKDLKVYLHMPD